MTRAQALEKVKKLLRLGKSSNAHEAAAAMRQAQALMRQHALDDGEVEDQEPDAVGEAKTAAARGAVPPVYALRLANSVADAFGVENVLRSTRGIGKHTVCFIGPSSRGEVAVYAYTVLLRQLERDKRAHIARVRVRKNRDARGDVFGCGWVLGVSSVLQRWEMSPKEKGQIEAFRAKTYPQMETLTAKARESKAVSYGDRTCGIENGRKARLNHGVAGSKQRAIGGPQ